MLLLSSCHDYHGAIVIEEDSDELVASTFTSTGYDMRSPRARNENPKERYNQISSQSAVITDNGGMTSKDHVAAKRDYCIMSEMTPLPLRMAVDTNRKISRMQHAE